MGLIGTECGVGGLRFQDLLGRRVEADFQGGEVTGEAGGLLLREADLRHRVTERFAACFADRRDARRVTHPLVSLVRQRVHGLALGYEDVVDHERLRHDAMMHLLAGEGDMGAPLAGKATLNRLEVSAAPARRNARYHRIGFRIDRFHALMREFFFESHKQAPAEIVLDLDATDLPVHGHQEGRFFHGYYDAYCFLPLYVFAGDDLLHAELRRADGDAAAGSVEALEPVVADIRKRWPACRIVVRGDSGFCREWLMRWCEERGICFILGLAQNKRLLARCGRAMEKARRRHLATMQPARIYRSFGYRTLGSWSARRRVVAKCEHLGKGANPRFVVTNLVSCEMASADLYERGYCPRGEMENRIGEQMELFADRTSCSAFDANALRLAMSALAYTLVGLVRRALAGTGMERARPDTIRLRLFKIGALVRQSTRRIVVHMASGWPWRETFHRCLAALRAPPAAA